jgi:hypothetical protein
LLHQSELQVEAGEWRPGPEPFADYAIRNIASLGPHAAPALPTLLAWFSERAEDGNARDILAGRMARAIQAIGPEAKATVPILLSLRPPPESRTALHVDLRQAIDDAVKRLDPVVHGRLHGREPPRLDVALLCRQLMDEEQTDLQEQLDLLQPGETAKEAIPFLVYRYRKEGHPEIGRDKTRSSRGREAGDRCRGPADA